ncbi:hypothetical protein HMPREF9309_00250 [Campylobacter ureolyticus ACS-301-V-Sch3b]|uniref:Autotransporter domain-containing protein n=2 Tax=Campylobacter ureolyticus TaxID=827 RepID=S3XK00_9BACT|nr:autotransporter outer membrane beta-barrel domain-containing protein [Campylobacter ureolyticus]AGS56890.1 hemagluttinin/autotransporter [Campylobacter ureolyticus]EPH10471.1 hypothetical protein HMPREF9309_00250 [Campylobacter ureolyticus ACS-301-V-Sch3b]
MNMRNHIRFSWQENKIFSLVCAVFICSSLNASPITNELLKDPEPTVVYKIDDYDKVKIFNDKSNRVQGLIKNDKVTSTIDGKLEDKSKTLTIKGKEETEKSPVYLYSTTIGANENTEVNLYGLKGQHFLIGGKGIIKKDDKGDKFLDFMASDKNAVVNVSFLEAKHNPASPSWTDYYKNQKAGVFNIDILNGTLNLNIGNKSRSKDNTTAEKINVIGKNSILNASKTSVRPAMSFLIDEGGKANFADTYVYSPEILVKNGKLNAENGGLLQTQKFNVGKDGEVNINNVRIKGTNTGVNNTITIDGGKLNVTDPKIQAKNFIITNNGIVNLTSEKPADEKLLNEDKAKDEAVFIEYGGGINVDSGKFIAKNLPLYNKGSIIIKNGELDIKDSKISTSQNFYVKEGGKATLDNTKYTGQEGINVEKGGEFKAKNKSNINFTNQSSHINGKAIFDDSTINSDTIFIKDGGEFIVKDSTAKIKQVTAQKGGKAEFLNSTIEKHKKGNYFWSADGGDISFINSNINNISSLGAENDGAINLVNAKINNISGIFVHDGKFNAIDSVINLKNHFVIRDDKGKAILDNSSLKASSLGGHIDLKNKVTLDIEKDKYTYRSNGADHSIDIYANVENATDIIKKGKSNLIFKDYKDNFKGNLNIEDGSLTLDGDFTLAKDKTLSMKYQGQNGGILKANKMDLKNGNLFVNLQKDASGVETTIAKTKDGLSFDKSKAKLEDNSLNSAYSLTQKDNNLILTKKDLDGRLILSKLDHVIKKDSKVYVDSSDPDYIDDAHKNSRNDKNEKGQIVKVKTEGAKLVIADVNVKSKGEGENKDNESFDITKDSYLLINNSKSEVDGLNILENSTLKLQEKSDITATNLYVDKTSKMSMEKRDSADEADKVNIIVKNAKLDGIANIGKDSTFKAENLNLGQNSKIDSKGTLETKSLKLTGSNIEASNLKIDKKATMSGGNLNIENAEFNREITIDKNTNLKANIFKAKNGNLNINDANIDLKDATINSKVDVKNSAMKTEKLSLAGNSTFDNVKYTTKHFEFKGDSLLIKNSVFNTTGDSSFIVSGDTNIDNSQTSHINMTLGKDKKTTAAIDNKTTLTVKNTLTFGPNDATLNLNNDAVLKVSKIAKDTSGSHNINVTNSTVELLDGGKLFSDFKDNDLNFKIKNAIFKTDGEKTINHSISGENFTKIGKGTIKTPFKNWKNTKVKEGVLNFTDSVVFKDEKLAISNGAIVKGDKDVTFDKSSTLEIGAKGDGIKNIQTGKLIANTLKIDGATLSVKDEAVKNLKNGDIIKQNKFLEYQKLIGWFNPTILEDLAFYDLSFTKEKDILIGVVPRAKDMLLNAGMHRLGGLGDIIDAGLIDNTLGDIMLKDNITANDLKTIQPLISGAGIQVISDAGKISRDAILSSSTYKSDKNFWAKTIGSFSHKSSTNDGTLGYDADHYGTIIGFDGEIADNARLGFAVSYTKSDIDGDINQNIKSDTYQALIYSDIYAINDLRINLLAGVGFSENEGDKTVSIIDKTIKSKYDSKFYQAGFGIYKDVSLSNSFSLTPYFRADYIHVKNDAYTENGDEFLALSVDKQDFDSLELQAGLESKYLINDKFSLFGKAGLIVETMDDETKIDFSLISNPSKKAQIKSDAKNDLLGVVGVGFDYMPTDSLKLEFKYNGKFGDDYNNQIIGLGLNYRF